MADICGIRFPGRVLANLADILTYQMPQLESLIVAAPGGSGGPPSLDYRVGFLASDYWGEPNQEWWLEMACLSRPAERGIFQWRDPHFLDSPAGRTWAITCERHRRGCDPSQAELSLALQTEVRCVVLVRRQAPPPGRRAPQGGLRGVAVKVAGNIICLAAAGIAVRARGAPGLVLAGAAVGCAMLWRKRQRGCLVGRRADLLHCLF